MDKQNNLLEYNLPQDAYAAFDAVTLKDFIIQRLNESGQFTDQNYEGSNLAAIIDIIAYSYHVLLFYLNNTASEVDYDQVTLYENMNKIVKLINYKPTGKQTALCSIDAVASDQLEVGDYTIKKYSYFLVDGLQYSFLDNYSFNINKQEEQILTNISENVVLFQGSINEYPDYVAGGESLETLTIVVDNIVNTDDQRFIADNTLSVYVKEIESGKYYEYREVDNLYITRQYERVYERRLNENGHFEIKFGDEVNGRVLREGDIVSVSYILSDGVKGAISSNAINGNKLFVYDSPRWREIYADVYGEDSSYTTINVVNSSKVNFSNSLNSSQIADAEGVEDIKRNANRLFSSQLRLVTPEDYESFIEKSFNNVLASTKVVDNDSYLNSYIDYFYSICVDPNKSNRVIINQVNFADSCDFNNVNVFTVPRFRITEDGAYPEFVSSSLKNLLIDSTKAKKVIGTEVVPRDPVYIAYGIGFSNKASPTLDIFNNSNLVIVREGSTRVNKDSLRTKVSAIIIDFFNVDNNELGQLLNLSDLQSRILTIEGIKRIYTENTEEGVTFNGVSLLGFNPLYPDSDIELANQTTQLPFFKFPYLYRPYTVTNNIKIVDE